MTAPPPEERQLGCAGIGCGMTLGLLGIFLVIASPMALVAGVGDMVFAIVVGVLFIFGAYYVLVGRFRRRRE